MRVLLPITVLVFLFSCKKEPTVVKDFGYDYYPNELGVWVEYTVTEINHDITSDTLTYLLREEVAAFFYDQQGRKTQRVERFWRENTGEDWVIKDVWYANVTTRTAEKIEENERFVKMNFPVRVNSKWDGNVYNTRGEWAYEYDSLHMPRTISGKLLDSTLRVTQRENFNLVQYQNAYEIYAKHVGMVRRQYINLDINNFDPQDIVKGKELYQEMTSFGKL